MPWLVSSPITKSPRSMETQIVVTRVEEEEEKWEAYVPHTKLETKGSSRAEAVRRMAGLLERTEEMIEALEDTSDLELENAQSLADALEEASENRTAAEAARSFRRKMRRAGVDPEELTDCSQVRKEIYAERKAAQRGEDRTREEILEDMES